MSDEFICGKHAFTDGACRVGNPGLCACGFVFYIDGVEQHRAARMLPGLNTNNVSEYTGLIDLLEWAKQEGVEGMNIHSDSKLVVEQVNGRWQVRPDLLSMTARAFGLLYGGKHSLFHVKGHAGIEGNEAVDDLCNQVLDEFQGKPAKKTRRSK